VWELLKRDWRNAEKRRGLHRLILAAVREIGVLLIAFSPLDAVVSADIGAIWVPVVFLFLFGVVLFVAGALGEWRLEDVDDSR
jgi:hypothetical protein